MRQDRINIWQDGEYRYAAAFGFQPNIRSYLHEDAEERPCVLVIPGGGYRMVSPTEGEIVAKWFFERGYQAFVGTYTTNLLGMEPLRLQPLNDISRMLRLIRSQAKEFHIAQGQIVLCGFSAGAHLCGSLCTHWKDVSDSVYGDFSSRPDGAILSYPVITAGEFAHRDSFTALLGGAAAEEELNYMSLEKQVTADMPPVFLWQTAEDELVPVENSYLMAMALRKAGVSFEHHVFPRGRHGLSLANEDWAEDRFGEPYTMEQIACLGKAAEEGRVAVSAEAQGALNFFLHRETAPANAFPPKQPVRQVAVWPELADQWIRETVILH